MIALWLDNTEHVQVLEFRGYSSRRESDEKVDVCGVFAWHDVENNTEAVIL